MNLHLTPLRSACVAGAIALFSAQSAHAAFVDFIIRGTPTITPGAGSSLEFIIDTAGQKAALGSSDIDGQTLGSIASLTIDRLDDASRFPAGSGPAFAPYLNFWITDGLGNYAVVANEPTNPAYQPFYNNGYDLDFADLSGTVAKIYENSDKSWLPDVGSGAGNNLTFADLAGFVIQAPTVAELTVGWAGLGTGAPRELGTNVAYGVNWVFGDTLANYTSGDPGYLVDNASVSASSVPEAATIGLFGLGLLGLGLAGRKRAA